MRVLGVARLGCIKLGSSNVGMGCGYPWRGLSASRGFLLIGDSLYGRIGRWDGSRFYADVDAGGYDFAEFGRIFTHLPTLVRFTGPGMVFGEAGLLGREYVVFGGIVAVGVPVVGSGLGGIPEIVDKYSAVALPSPERIAEAVAKVLEAHYDREEMRLYAQWRG